MSILGAAYRPGLGLHPPGSPARVRRPYLVLRQPPTANRFTFSDHYGPIRSQRPSSGETNVQFYQFHGHGNLNSAVYKPNMARRLPAVATIQGG